MGYLGSMAAPSLYLTAQSSSLRIRIVVTRFQIKGRAKARTPDLDNNKKHGTMRGTHRLCNLTENSASSRPARVEILETASLPGGCLPMKFDDTVGVCV